MRLLYSSDVGMSVQYLVYNSTSRPCMLYDASAVLYMVLLFGLAVLCGAASNLGAILYGAPTTVWYGPTLIFCFVRLYVDF